MGCGVSISGAARPLLHPRQSSGVEVEDAIQRQFEFVVRSLGAGREVVDQPQEAPAGQAPPYLTKLAEDALPSFRASRLPRRLFDDAQILLGDRPSQRKVDPRSGSHSGALLMAFSFALASPCLPVASVRRQATKSQTAGQ
jgi:hypothetical protein